jgi:mxaK protein
MTRGRLYLSRRVEFALLAIVAAAAAFEFSELMRTEAWNRQIVAGTSADTGADHRSGSGGLPAEVRFARAAELAAKGDIQAALVAYRAIRPDSDPERATAARYNSANLLLAQALALDEKTAQGQRIPLIELAKETYREVLRSDPDHWDARFNLERAQRLLPDPDEGEEAGNDPPPGAERAVTTMRGYSPGLP